MCGVVYLILLFITIIESGENEKWKKKDIRDYTDADLERLYDQWEVSVVVSSVLSESKHERYYVNIAQICLLNCGAPCGILARGTILLELVEAFLALTDIGSIYLIVYRSYGVYKPNFVGKY